jgi:hypothetical protein
MLTAQDGVLTVTHEHAKGDAAGPVAHRQRGKPWGKDWGKRPDTRQLPTAAWVCLMFRQFGLGIDREQLTALDVGVSQPQHQLRRIGQIGDQLVQKSLRMRPIHGAVIKG